MKTIILTSGPRGAGKSTYIERVQSIHPEVGCLSRDKLLIELFGATTLDPYTGGHFYAREIFHERLKNSLAKPGPFKLIVDFWNGFSNERQSLVRRFREYGADRVVCWQFVPSLDVCLRWFFKKPDSIGYSEYGCRNDYKLYYEKAKDIEEDGFDAVYRINPCQLTFPGFQLI